MDHEYNCPGRTTDVGLPPEPEPAPITSHPFVPCRDMHACVICHHEINRVQCAEPKSAHAAPEPSRHASGDGCQGDPAPWTKPSAGPAPKDRLGEAVGKLAEQVEYAATKTAMCQHAQYRGCIACIEELIRAALEAVVAQERKSALERELALWDALDSVAAGEAALLPFERPARGLEKP